MDIGAGAGDTMVFVKVRETYDLHTITNKMSIIGIHTPHSSIIKKQYPGLLMQCRAYRPVSVDIRCACASVLPSDPLSVGTVEGQVSPEDLFNPILYKTLTNKGMSQIESYVIRGNSSSDFHGSAVTGDNTGIGTDDFNLYYGLLSDTNGWAHANPQSGFQMTGVKPLVYEVLQTIGDESPSFANGTIPTIQKDGTAGTVNVTQFRGSARPMPFLNCTSYTFNGTDTSWSTAGFTDAPGNAEIDVPSPRIFCAAVIVPPSRLHKLYYRMVVEWTLEFTGIRSMTEITNWSGLQALGTATHFQSYDYTTAKTVASIPEDSSMLAEDTAMVSTSDGMDINKVM